MYADAYLSPKCSSAAVEYFQDKMQSKANLFSHDGQAKAYGLFRPRYNDELFNAIYAYAGPPQTNRALDIATGYPTTPCQTSLHARWKLHHVSERVLTRSALHHQQCACQANTRNARNHLCPSCFTGSGQAATELAKQYSTVIAQDPSTEQLSVAEQSAPNVSYEVATAEATGQPDASCDLVTVAQGMHWCATES